MKSKFENFFEWSYFITGFILCFGGIAYSIGTWFNIWGLLEGILLFVMGCFIIKIGYKMIREKFVKEEDGE